jgi:3-methyladenine DNA glycosylase/8-oxoguanine DNA glycosylase
MEFVVSTPADFSFTETVSAHGWRRLLPFEWNEDTQTLSRTEAFADGSIAFLKIRAAAHGGVSVSAEADYDSEEVTARVRRMLQLDLPLDEFHAYCRTRAELAHLTEHRRGRLLRSPTLWEDTVKVIATTNTTWAQTISMTARLVAEFGTEGRAYPTPAQIAAAPFDDFAAKARMGYRAAYVHAIAAAICDGALDLEAWQAADLAADDLRKRLLGLPGIGPYGAACLMLYLGKPAHVNTDSVARAALSQELGHPVTDKEVHAFFEAHGEWRGLVYNFYPWNKT